MIEETRKFEDPDTLLEAILRQVIVFNDENVAAHLVATGKLEGFAPGQELMAQEGTDRDAYFILSGKAEIRVNGMLLDYGRGPGDVVGEFAAINTALHRTATIVASEPLVALKVSHADFTAAGNKGKRFWRDLAISLTSKIEQRNRFVGAANAKPSIFMIAAEDQLGAAEALRDALQDAYDVVLWGEEELFPPANYELQRLSGGVARADFGLVLAHPDDLRRARDREDAGHRDTILFELGYLMSVLGPQRTLLLIPEGSRHKLPDEFKGMRPWTYPAIGGKRTAEVALSDVMRRLENFITEKNIRSRLERGE